MEPQHVHMHMPVCMTRFTPAGKGHDLGDPAHVIARHQQRGKRRFFQLQFYDGTKGWVSSSGFEPV